MEALTASFPCSRHSTLLLRIKRIPSPFDVGLPKTLEQTFECLIESAIKVRQLPHVEMASHNCAVHRLCSKCRFFSTSLRFGSKYEPVGGLSTSPFAGEYGDITPIR